MRPSSVASTTCTCLRNVSTRSALANRAVRSVGKHVVHAGDVVAERRGRPRTEEHRARVAHQREQRLGIGGEELEVLGRDGVDRVERGHGVVDQHDPAPGAERRGDLGPPGCVGEQLRRGRRRWRRPRPAIPRDEDGRTTRDRARPGRGGRRPRRRPGRCRRRRPRPPTDPRTTRCRRCPRPRAWPAPRSGCRGRRSRRPGGWSRCRRRARRSPARRRSGTPR